MPTKRTSGRPRIKKGLTNFRLSPEAARALKSMARRYTWTKTTAVERSLLFCNAHPEFGRPLDEEVA